MVMKALRDGAQGGITKFFLFGFLVLAVGGLVMTDVGGFFRGGVSGTDVAKIGSEKIKIGEFDRTLRRAISSVGLSPQDAYKLGYVNQVLAGEIRATLLKESAKDNGILVSDKRVAEKIKTLVEPLAQSGQDTKDVFSQILRVQGMSEKSFVQAIKRDIGNGLLLDMINNNFSAVPDEMAQDLFKHQNEKRTIKYITFPDKSVTNIKPASTQQLQQLYSATRESYAQEETRELKIVTLDTDALRKTLSISQEDIKQAYEDNIDFYSIAASWSLDQAIVPTEAQAQKIYEAARKGAPLKEAVEDITSNTSGYLGIKDTQIDGLLEALKEPVKSTTKAGRILNPVKSPLGWHIVKVKKVNKAKIKTLNEVKNEIEEEIAESQLIDQQYDLANEIDDLLASGATLDEVAAQVDLKITALPPLNGYGLDKKGSDKLKKYKDTKNTIIESGFSLGEGEASPIFETPEGKFMAVYLTRIHPKSYTPFEEVKKTLAKRWISDQKRLENRSNIREMLASNKSLKDLAKTHSKSIKTRKDISRTQKDQKPFAQYVLPNIFEAKINIPIILEIEGGIAIAEISAYSWPKIDSKSAEYKSFKSTLSTSAKNEALRAYLEKQQRKYKAIVNEKLITQVYGPETQNF